jgi:hypothetical protein
MEIQSKPPTAKGPAECFTGDAWIDAIARGEEPSRVRVSAGDERQEPDWGKHVTDAEYHGR